MIHFPILLIKPTKFQNEMTEIELSDLYDLFQSTKLAPLVKNS